MATVANTTTNTVAQRLIGGAIGGAAGGLLFGAVMGFGGMLPMVGMLVGTDTVLVGFVVHMVISVIIGAAFGFLAGFVKVTSYQQGALWGLGYGALWWVLGPLMLMPLMMGMGLMFHAALDPGRLMSLGGHLVYGLVAGLAYVWYVNRSA